MFSFLSVCILLRYKSVYKDVNERYRLRFTEVVTDMYIYLFHYIKWYIVKYTKFILHLTTYTIAEQSREVVNTLHMKNIWMIEFLWKEVITLYCKTKKYNVENKKRLQRHTFGIWNEQCFTALTFSSCVFKVLLKKTSPVMQ